MSHIEKPYKRILYLHLDTEMSELKLQEDVWDYIGGMPLAYKLFSDYVELNPIVIACGCLSGYFPYLSKSVLVSRSGEAIIEKYGGGTLAGAMRAAAIDALVILGSSADDQHITIFGDTASFEKKKNTPSHTSHADVHLSHDIVMSKGYFSFGDFKSTPLSVSASVHIDIKHVENRELDYFYDYEEMYQDILDQYRQLTVEPRNNPSCFGCPMGCDKSHEGEDGTNIAVLPRTLIACAYAEEIYRNIPFVYSCLSSVQYTYKHEQLEGISNLHGATKALIQKQLLDLKETA